MHNLLKLSKSFLSLVRPELNLIVRKNATITTVIQQTVPIKKSISTSNIKIKLDNIKLDDYDILESKIYTYFGLPNSKKSHFVQDVNYRVYLCPQSKTK
jgi:hypothetical protein